MSATESMTLGQLLKASLHVRMGLILPNVAASHGTRGPPAASLALRPFLTHSHAHSS